MKSLLPILFSIPTTFVWLVLLYRLINREPLPRSGAWIAGLSFLALNACIAMKFVKPASREWRYALIYNAVPWALILVFFLLFAFGN